LETFRYLVAVTRPRFWLYLAGPYLLGYTGAAMAAGHQLTPEFWVYLAFFLLPANLLLYGINDLCDVGTDQLNPKKGTVEARLDGRERLLLRTVLACLPVYLAAVVLLPTWPARAALTLFLALSAAYSLPPVRFKARPFFDMASNVLYALPGYVGYTQAGGDGMNLHVLGFAWCWTAAMHLFSAIPDIESDRRAAVATTATVLGAPRSLQVCALVWAAGAGLLIAGGVLWPWNLLTLVYPAIPLVLLMSLPSHSGIVTRAYWAFPILNGVLGMLAFFVIALNL